MHWILSQKGEIGMKKIYLLLFLCACITSCGRVNENDMKQISNSTQGTQTNKDRIFSIEDRVYTSQKQIGMKKIYLLLFLCACITLCVRVNGGIFIIQS